MALLASYLRSFYLSLNRAATSQEEDVAESLGLGGLRVAQLSCRSLSWPPLALAPFSRIHAREQECAFCFHGKKSKMQRVSHSVFFLRRCIWVEFGRQLACGSMGLVEVVCPQQLHVGDVSGAWHPSRLARPHLRAGVVATSFPQSAGWRLQASQRSAWSRHHQFSQVKQDPGPARVQGRDHTGA